MGGKGGGLKAMYLGCVKATGLAGLAFVPFLAFAVASGFVAVPELLAAAIELALPGVAASLVMISDTGLARLALRPQTLARGVIAFAVLNLLCGLVLAQVVLSLVVFDMIRLLTLAGVNPQIAPMLFVALVAPVAIAGGLAPLLALAVRFCPQDEAAPVPASTVAPVRVRPVEHDAALRAMRRRMAERQASAQVQG